MCFRRSWRFKQFNKQTLCFVLPHNPSFISSVLHQAINIFFLLWNTSSHTSRSGLYLCKDFSVEYCVYINMQPYTIDTIIDSSWTEALHINFSRGRSCLIQLVCAISSPTVFAGFAEWSISLHPAQLSLKHLVLNQICQPQHFLGFI